MNSSSFAILRSGFGLAAGSWRVLVALYCFNLILVLPLVLAFRATFAVLLGAFPAIEELFPGFNFMLYNDLTRTFGHAVSMVSASFFPVAVLSLILHAFLGMGLAHVLDAGGSIREFFSAVGSFAGRATRLLLIFLVAGGLLLVAWGFLCGTLFALMTSGQATEDTYLRGILVFVLLMGAALAVVSLGAEYARIFTVRENGRSMLRNAWRGVVFVVSHPVRIVSIHGFLLVSILISAVLYWFLESIVGMTSTVGVILLLFLQQTFVVVRIFIRMWNTAGAVIVSSTVERLAKSGMPRWEPPDTGGPGPQRPSGSRPFPPRDGRPPHRRRGRGPSRPGPTGPGEARPRGGESTTPPPVAPTETPSADGGGQKRRSRRRRRPRRRPGQRGPQGGQGKTE